MVALMLVAVVWKGSLQETRTLQFIATLIAAAHQDGLVSSILVCGQIFNYRIIVSLGMRCATPVVAGEELLQGLSLRLVYTRRAWLQG